MSDGPHKSLNVRRGWKRLMECAGNPAFDTNDVADACSEALRGDWRSEVPQGFVADLRNILGDPEGDLFEDVLKRRLQAVRGDTAGLPLAGTLLDSVLQVVDEGDRGDEALTKAASYGTSGTRGELSAPIGRALFACVFGAESHGREQPDQRCHCRVGQSFSNPCR